MKEVTPDLLEDTNEFIFVLDRFVRTSNRRYEFKSIVAGTMGWLVTVSKDCKLSEEEFMRMWKSIWLCMEDVKKDGEVS